MRISLPLKIAALATAIVTSLNPFAPVEAFTYDETEVKQDDFIAIAAPFGENLYNLLVIEQIPGKKKCWSEENFNPVNVDPLLLNFDFSGHCKRSTDSNGYSLRIDSQDYGLEYILSIVQRDGELQLIGTPTLGSNQPEILVGRSNGYADGYVKLFLQPGWKFAKRTYEGKVLGHVYFSGNSSQFGTPGPIAVFRDIATDIYRPEIERAVEVGFIGGFPDRSFRPRNPLTREQLVSMTIDALKSLSDTQISVPEKALGAPYPDVPSNRWSAAKIQWAKENNIVSGYRDGTFRPANEVTRAELMAVLKKAAIFANQQLGKPAELIANQQATSFSDTSGHWAESLIGEMSAYCGVASPLNESGSSFYPNNASQRNYAAAATLRTLQCVQPET